MAKRTPKPIPVGPLRCRADSRRSLPGPPRVWYWRVFYRDRTIASGWYTPEEVVHVAIRLLQEDNFIPATDGKPRTVGQLLRVWAAHYRKRNDIDAKTLGVKRRNLRHLLAHLDDILLAELGQADIDNYRDERLDETGAPSTIEIEHRTLRQAWGWGRKRSYVTGTAPELEIEKWSVYNDRTPSDDEIDAVMALLGERATRRVNGARWPKMCVRFMKETGARLHEVGTLVWSRIELDGAKPRVTLLGKRTRKGRRKKENQPRTIPISVALATELKLWAMQVGHRSADSPLLGVSHGTCRSRGIWHIKEACRELGIEPFTNHGIRRRAIRRFRRAEVHVNEAAEYFGHSPVTMMRIYDEIEPADLERAVEKVYGAPPP